MKKTESNASVIKWTSHGQDAILSINFIKLSPDLPTVKDSKIIRDFYRTQIAPSNGGLIQADIVDIRGIATVKCIFKISQQGGPMIYLASLTIPFDDYSYVVKVQAMEAGITGMRDAIILNKLLASGEIEMKDEKLEGWFADPYEITYRSGILMNKSDHQSYDIEFPDHPLTLVRTMIEQLQKEISFDPEIFKLAGFDK